MADNETKKPTEFQRKFRAIMLGLAAGSGAFLIMRYLFSVSVDVGLIVFGFFSFAVATFMWTYEPQNKGKSD